MSVEDVFCVLPWIGLDNLPDGEARPCCNWGGDRLGRLPPMTSVLIPCWNALRLTRVCLEQTRRKTYN